jgi:hypothetical protein
VVLYRVTAVHHVVQHVRPNVSLALNWAPATSDSTQRTVTEVLSDNGSTPLTGADLKLTAPAGVTVTSSSPTKFKKVTGGSSAQATFKVTIPSSTELFASSAFSGSASFRYQPGPSATLSVGDTITVDHPVLAPYETFASTTAGFSQSGTQLGIQAQGADLWNTINEYGSIYLPGAEHDGSTTTVKLNSQADTDVWAKAGIMVRNDITGADTSAGYLALVETPANGYLLDWDSDGDGKLDSQDSTGTATYPSWLKLVRDGTTFSGYYSTDGTTWNLVGTVNVPSAAATQDVGLTATSHAAQTTGEVDFDNFTTSP